MLRFLMKKSEFKDLLSLATKESCFIFNIILYKQIDEVAMGSSLGLSRLDRCPLENLLLYYRRYVDDIFVLFKSSDHLKRFQICLNSC